MRKTLSWTLLLGAHVLAPTASHAGDGWISLFDGKTLQGWKAAEHPETVRVTDGVIECNGPRAHLFYVGTGDPAQAQFENFELHAEVWAAPGANSGVYFQTEWQDSGWPWSAGFEAQVNNTQPPFGDNYRENKKTGSLYGIHNLYKPVAKDEQWVQLDVTVRRPTVEIRVNGQTVTRYTEASNPILPPGGPTLNRLGKGLFALQCHDENSRVRYRNLKVRRLPDGESPAVKKPVLGTQDVQRLVLGRENFPLLDLHAAPSTQFPLTRMIEESEKTGIGLGLLIDSASVSGDEGALRKTQEHAKSPRFVGLLVQDRAWTRRLPASARARFDYVTGLIGPAASAEQFVQDTVRALESEPLDILSDPFGMRHALALGSAQRQQIIEAAVKHGVALELATRQPSLTTEAVQQVKASGGRFAVGAPAATPATWSDWEALLAVVQASKLTWRDMYVPGHAPSRAQRELPAAPVR